jgi:uncharacterized protein (DUF924 family)
MPRPLLLPEMAVKEALLAFDRAEAEASWSISTDARLACSHCAIMRRFGRAPARDLIGE